MAYWGRGKNKFNATKIKEDGYSFDSKMERSGLTMLKARENNGEIKDIVHHPCQIVLFKNKYGKIIYKPDYSFFHIPTNELRYCEIKGCSTDTWRLKKVLYGSFGPAILEIFKGDHKRLYLDETIVPRNDNLDETDQ